MFRRAILMFGLGLAGLGLVSGLAGVVAPLFLFLVVPGLALALAALGLPNPHRRRAGYGPPTLAPNPAAPDTTALAARFEEISFRTNALALSATVAAARSGPEGEGFSSVAAEVRSLARLVSEARADLEDIAHVAPLHPANILSDPAPRHVHDQRHGGPVYAGPA